MAKKKKVLITGASGLIGGLVIAHLGEKYELSGLSRRPVQAIPSLAASITDGDAIKPAFVGVDTVLHLAAATHGFTEDWDTTMTVTVGGTLNVYEAARIAGVKRIVFMSSGSTQLGYMTDDALPYGRLASAREDAADFPTSWPMITLDDPPRPIDPYAVGKLYGENAGRFYADRHGISTLAIRLGGVLPENRPHVRGIWPGFLDHSDAMDMIDRCISAPDELSFDVFNAISNNQWRWREIDHGREVLGWQPTGSAEAAAARDGITPGNERGPSTPPDYEGYGDR
jgi:nucleoside-diphosphate-sugar epimerase